MKMNWSHLEKDMNKKELFDEFWEQYVSPAKRKIELEQKDGSWRRCLNCPYWCVEHKSGTNQVRIRNLKTSQVCGFEETELYLAIRKFLKQKSGVNARVQNNIGLVLEGGGARGAYQIGVWRALREVGIDKYINAIAGTSIGAINMLLVALGDYHAAERVWMQVSQPEFRKVNRERIEKFTKAYSRNVMQNFNPIYSIVEKEFISQPELKSMMQKAVTGKAKQINDAYHLFSTLTPIEECEKLLQNKLLETTWKTPVLDGAHYVSWKTLSAMEIVSAALASAAIPIIYDAVEFKGKQYYDGGLFDNTPVRPLYQCGCRKFLIVHLNKSRENIKELDRVYSDCKIVHFVPGENFRDDFFSMLDLNVRSTETRIRMGFREGLLTLDRNTPKLREMLKGAANGI